MTLSKLDNDGFYVLKFEPEQYDIETMQAIYESLKNVFGDKLICIPNDMNLSIEQKEELINYIKEH